MFNWITKYFKTKVVDARAFMGVDWPGSYVDAYRRVPKPNKEKLVNEYKGFAYICSNYNARVVFSTPLKLYRRLDKNEKCRWKTKVLTLGETRNVCKANRINLATGERIEEVTNHPALQLLKCPNPEMSGLRLLEYIQLYQEMAGECALHVVTQRIAGEKVPVGLYLLQPQYLKAEEDPKTGFVAYYAYGGKEQIRLETDEVIRFLLPNISSPYLASHSPLLGVFEDVNILDLFKATEAAILNNEGRPDVLVSAKDGIGDPERFEKKFITKFRRGGKAGIMFAEDDVTVTPLSWTPKDLAFVKVAEQARSMIALAYGIPPALLSDQGASQYNVDNTLANRHVINAIVPRLERNTDVWNTHYLPMFDDSGLLFFGYDDPSVVNKEQKLEEDTKLVQANIITPNEVRIGRGYEPTAWGEVPAGMYNVTGTASTSPVATGDEAAPGPEADNTADTSEEAAQNGDIQGTALNGTQIASLLQIAESVGQGLLTPEACRLLILASFPLLDSGLVAQLVKELAKIKVQPAPTTPAAAPQAPDSPLASSQGAKALCQCKGLKSKDSGLPNPDKLVGVLKGFFKKQKAEVLASLKNKAKALPKKFVPLEKWNKELYTDSQPLIEMYFAKQYKETAGDIRGRTGISPDVFNVTNPETKKAVQKLALRFCEETNKTTSDNLNNALDDLRDSFEEGLTEGERMSQLVDRVSSIFDSAETERAELIAQTESSRAHHEGLRQAAKDSGVVKGFQLLPSSGCCDLCQQVAEEVGEIGLDDSFYTDESAPEEYQDRFCPIHPNCECTVIQVLIDSPDEEAGAE